MSLSYPTGLNAFSISGISSSSGISYIEEDNFVLPTPSWRLPVLDTYNSTGTDSTFRTNMLAAHTTKNLINLSSPAVGAGVQRVISVKVDEIAEPGGMLGFRTDSWQGAAFYGTISGTTLTVSTALSGTITIGQTLTGFGVLPLTTITGGSGTSWTISQAHDFPSTTFLSSSLVHMEVYESFDSTDGSIASGTWTLNSFCPHGPFENAPGPWDRAQIANLAAGPSRWVQLRITNGTAGSLNIITQFFSGQYKMDGSHDLWGYVTMSIGRGNMGQSAMRTEVRTIAPNADPYMVDLGRGSATAASMLLEQINPLLNASQLSQVKNVMYDGSAADVAYTGIRPYTGKPSDVAVGTSFQNNLDLLINKFGARHVFVPNLSYMNFHTGDGGGGASPYVDNVVDSANGSLPYNTNIIEPIIKAKVKRSSWLDAYDTPLVNDYWGHMLTLIPTVYPADPVHGGQTTWNSRRRAWFQRAYGVTETINTVQQVRQIVGAANTSAVKTMYQTLVANGFGPTTDATAIANRAALVSEAATIVSTFAEPTLTGSAILPPDVTTGTLVADFDASQFDKFSRSYTNVVTSLTDKTANAYVMTQANSTPMSYTRQFDGTAPYIDFTFRYGNRMQCTASGLKTLLDAANSAFTFFCVLTLNNGGQNGYGSGVFSVGGATSARASIYLPSLSRVPRLITGDGTGSTNFDPTDAGLVAGVRAAFAFRMDASGNLKYYRGGTTATSTTTRLAAITSTANAIIGTTYNADTNATLRDPFHVALVYAGAVSDAEVGYVLDGLRQKWTDALKTCI